MDDDTEAVHQGHAAGLCSGSSLHEQSVESSFLHEQFVESSFIMTSDLRTYHVIEDLTELLPEEPGTNTCVTNTVCTYSENEAGGSGSDEENSEMLSQVTLLVKRNTSHVIQYNSIQYK